MMGQHCASVRVTEVGQIVCLDEQRLGVLLGTVQGVAEVVHPSVASPAHGEQGPEPTFGCMGKCSCHNGGCGLRKGETTKLLVLFLVRSTAKTGDKCAPWRCCNAVDCGLGVARNGVVLL